MYLPSVRAPGKTRRQIVQFGGLNYAEDTRDGELSDSRGLSCGAFPGLSQRLGRHKLQDAQGVSSIYAWGKLVTVAGDTLYYDGVAKGTVTPGKKQFAVVNTKLVVFPDKKYLDLETEELKPLGASVTRKAGTALTWTNTALTMAADAVLGEISCFTQPRRPKTVAAGSGHTYYIKTYDSVKWVGGAWETEGEHERCTLDANKTSSNGSYGMDFIGQYVILRDTDSGPAANVKTVVERWDSTGRRETIQEDYGEESKGKYGKIVSVELVDQSEVNPDVYAWDVRLNIEAHDGTVFNTPLTVFQPGDVVTVSECETFPENNRDVKITAVTETTLTFDSPVFAPGEEAGEVTVERKIPDLDFICESGNRLCGVSNKDKTIYVSALGDPRNIFDYTGVATDSYAVVTGTDGDFTGCAAWSGSVLFFKEDCVHRLVGDYPAEYAVYVDHVAGVQKGCVGSIVLLNEVLYYKGREGIYAYTGATPRLISGALGNARYDSAVAGVDGSVLYFSMRRQDTGTWELLTYDTRRGLWLKEDEVEAGGFAQLDGTLHMLAGGAVWQLGQGETDDGAAIAWEATFTPFTETVHERKYPSRLLLRLELEPGAWVEAELARDGGAFQTVWSSHDSNALTAVIPIRPGRCDRYMVRLRGEGRCLIRSMAREFALGGVR